MATTYEVNYIVNVQSNQARNAINSFKTALNSLTKATKPLTDLQRQIMGLTQTLGGMSKAHYTIKVDTKPATQKIGKLIRSLQMAQNEARKLSALGIQMRTSQPRQQSQRAPRSVPATPVPTRTTSYRTPTTKSGIPLVRNTQNLGYKLWGPTPLPNNGGMAIDMLKGMGIAYGLAGLGTLVSNVVSQATEYDNIMKTVENILKSHDDKGNFSSRFSAMTATVRNVGMETKFKVTEVADAAKFLAMAGLDLEAIQKAIRPIADIALVGDTDLGETADLVTNIMTAYNIAPEKMRLAADVMTNTFTMSNTTLTEIAEAYKYAASLLSAGGVSFEEATAAIGVLGDAGIKGSQAGTTMRTIMANIVNPTKKQKAAWDAIGVSRTDASGKTKDLLEIFKELNAAGLGVDDYYKLFHKTAASGAVALAAHVDKWDNVLTENLMAGGLSSRLAEEKKNTLQGLWAQLTSVFTDNGVSAFNGIQGTIRDYLKQTIEWLKSDEAKQAINKIAETLVSFLSIMKDVSKFFYGFYKIAGPFIMTWMKFQLYIWPVVKAITAFRSVMLGLMGLKKVGTVLLGIGQSFRMVGAGVAATNVAMTNGAAASAAMVGGGRVMTPYGIAAGLPWLPALSPRAYEAAAKGLNLKAPLPVKQGMSPRIYEYLSNKNREYYSGLADRQKTYQNRIVRRQFLQGAGNVAGMVGVGLGASMAMDEEMGTAGHVAGGLLMGAGTVAMMATGPVGWTVAGVLALGSAIMYVAEKMNQIAAAGKRITETAQQFSVVEGRIVNEKATDVASYLTMIHTKHQQIDDLLQLRIKHTRELLGLEAAPSSPDNSASTDTFLKEFNDLNHYRVPVTYMNENADVLSVLGLSGGRENDNYFLQMGDNKVALGEVATAGNLAIASEVRSGKYTESLFEEFGRQQQKAILENDIEGLRRLGENLKKQWGPESWNEIDWHQSWTADQWKKFAEDPAAFAQNGLYQRMVYNRFVKDYGVDNDAVLAMESFHNALNGRGGNIVDTFLDLYRFAGPGLTLENYTNGGWLANNGWNGYTFVPMGDNINGLEQAQVVLKQIEDLSVIMTRLGLYNSDDEGVKTMLADIETLRKNAEGYIALTQGKPLPEGWTIPEGFTVPYNGLNYRWNSENQTFEELLSDDESSMMMSRFLNNVYSRGWDASNLLSYNWGSSYGSATSWSWNNGFNTTFTPVSDENNWIPGAMYGGINFLLGSSYNNIGSLGYNWGSSYGFTVGSNFNSGFNYGFGSSTGFGGGLGVGTGGGFTIGGTSSIGLGNSNGGLFSGGLFNTGSQFGIGAAFQRNFLRNTGPLVNPRGTSFTLPQFQTNVGNQLGVKPPTVPNPSGGNGGGGRGTNSKDYGSHYKNSAQPKQINIKIDNLMKVDKVDLSNPDQAAVVDRLKREVAYALYEAAADGATMLNGLTS